MDIISWLKLSFSIFLLKNTFCVFEIWKVNSVILLFVLSKLKRIICLVFNLLRFIFFLSEFLILTISFLFIE